MSEPTPHERALAQHAGLRETQHWLTLRHAEVEERAGRVHDEVARVHEQLGQRSLLDPVVVRREAGAARDRAALERRRAARHDDPQDQTPD